MVRAQPNSTKIKRIKFTEFESKLRDISISDAELCQYFAPNPDYARPFSPSLRIDTERVDIGYTDIPRTEGRVAFEFVNDVARFRRKSLFRRNVDSEKSDTTATRKILVTEGDSWFQFPFFLRDVVDNLSETYNVFSVGAAGDTTKNMIFENPEYLFAIEEATDLAKNKPHGFFFSSGGNDILGLEEEEGKQKPVFNSIVRPISHGQSFDIKRAFVEDKLNMQFNMIRDGYIKMIQEIRNYHPDLPIFLHAYDNVFPHDPTNNDDKRRPLYAKKDQWICGPLNALGIRRFEDQRSITNYLVAKLKRILSELASDSRWRLVYYVDTGSPLENDVSLWNDEIHPNDDGFSIVSNKIQDFIAQRI